MKPIPILGIGLQSKSSNVTAQSRLNCYMDNSDDKNTVVAIGRPGLFLAMGWDGDYIRAMYVANGFLWIVENQRIYKLSETTGTFTSVFIGSVHYSDGYMEISDNGVELIFSDNGQYIYTYNFSTSTFSAMTDVDFPYSSDKDYQSVCFLDSFIIANKPGDNKFQWSSSFDATAWDALDIVSAESYPDNIIKIIANNGYLYVFGSESTEFFTSDITGFSVVKGLTLSHGLAAIQSVAKVSSGVICLTTNRNGTSQVSIVSPGQITKVSTNDIDTLINDYSSILDGFNITDATGLSYVLNGHEFYQLNFTEKNKSFLYDLTMGLWSELTSYNNRHFGNIAVKFNNKTYLSDYRLNGRVYFLDASKNDDNSIPIEFELTAKHVFNGLEKVSIKSLQIDAETGLLTDSGTYQNSQMMIGVSKDNGKSFVESFVSMGYGGETKTRCRKNRLGLARDWVFRIRITDKIKRVVLGAYVELN